MGLYMTNYKNDPENIKMDWAMASLVYLLPPTYFKRENTSNLGKINHERLEMYDQN